jgi:hypothetical protein
MHLQLVVVDINTGPLNYVVSRTAAYSSPLTILCPLARLPDGASSQGSRCAALSRILVLPCNAHVHASARLFARTLVSAVSQGRRLFVIEPKKQTHLLEGDLTTRGDLASDITILVWEDM